MKPFFVLIISFLLALTGTRLFQHQLNYIFAGNVSMCIMLLFTSIGHFAFAKGMAMMLPAFVPNRKSVIYLTGFLEIIGAIALCIPSTRHWAAVALIIFFIVLLPANIYAAVNHIDYEKGTHDGKGPSYLWIRVPLQILFIAWVWYFSF